MGKFETEYARLNAAQRKAVDTIEGPVLVIAGPGTGKTQLLSMRVANILRRTDVNPNNILCLTYTESGQEAMRHRLEDMLGTPAKRVEIHTFHGFGTYLINKFPEYFPELAHFRPADDLALYETMTSCLRRLPRSNPLSKSAYGEYVYLKDASSRISQLKQAGILPDEALNQAEADAEWCRGTGRKITKLFNETGRLSAKSIPALTATLEPLLTKGEGDGLAQTCTAELREALDEANASGKTNPITRFKKRWFVTEEGKLYFKPADQLKKLRALAELYELYEAELQSRKLYDYDDMILYALKRLERDNDFLATIRESFQYILADEYQDTNAAQARIITLIADSPVNEGRPNVMVVGDDDQAIYGFQGALGDVMLHFRERWRDVTVITLAENYRSSQAIIDTARKVITRGQNRLENYYDDIDKTLAGQTGYPAVEPALYSASSPEAVLHQVVSAARNHRQEDGQLAIIATKHKYLRELADRLDAAKVRYYYEGREDLLRDEGVLTVLRLAGACLAVQQGNLKQTNYLLPELIARGTITLAKTHAWEIAITAKQNQTSWWEELQNTRHEDASAAAALLQAVVAELAPDDGLASMRMIASQFGIRVASKLKQITAHAKTYYGRETITLGNLLVYTDLCQRAGVTLSQKVVKGKVGAGVLLLSAHKSKGLEFDRVYLLHADYYTWFKEQGRRNNISLPPGWEYLEPAKETMDDRLRLLYVVMTRAKRELSLVKSSGGRSEEPLPGLEDIEAISHTAEQLEVFELASDNAWQTWYLPKGSVEREVLRGLLRPALASYRLSPSHLTAFTDAARNGPATFFVKTLLGIPEPVHPEAVFGSHVHAALRFAQDTLNTSGRLPSLDTLFTFIQKEGPHASPGMAEDVADTVHEFLEHTDILQPGGVGEYSFSKHHLQLDGMRLTGNVDSYRTQDKTITITDFKTGRALNSWHVTEDYYKQKLRRFRQQLLFYELLFSLSPEFKAVENYQLQVAFVEPSRRESYCTLVLDADDSERQTLRSLMHTVWKHVQSLDFPDTTQYSPSHQGLLDFEQDLINGRV